MTLWNVESWTVEPHGVYFVARQLVADGVANHEDHTIETQVKNLVEDTVKTQVENVEQAFKSLNISCSGAFALGYDVGESTAGQLYVLVSFDENFTARQDVIYETL